MEEKKYLKWYQKVAYGSGDMAGNFMYMLVSAFILIYLTNTVGLNAGIVGTLMMLARFLDGVADLIFGNIMDKTRHKMGKARPWMFWSAFPLAICEILLFTIPNLSHVLQYVYFFIIYIALNTICYTVNNISYSSLISLITKNSNERVQLGSIRFMFALFTSIVISAGTMSLVGVFGGGTAGWRMVAIIYSALLVLFNTISVLSVKELPIEDEENNTSTQKTSLISNVKLLLRNRYYLLILAYYLLFYGSSGISQGVTVYFCTYALKNPSFMGLLSMAGMLPMIIGLMVTPFLASKWGIYKVNLIGIIMSVLFSIPLIIAGYQLNITMFLIFTVLKGLCMSPMLGTLNAIIADAATYTYNKEGVRLEGTMFSCSSIGIKVGGGIGTALCGWLLTWSGYNGLAEVQTTGAINMMYIMVLIIPFVATVAMIFVFAGLNVQKANKMLVDAK